MAMQTTNCCTTDSSCTVKQPTTAHLQHCPACDKQGKQVGMETVKALLAVTLHKIQPDSNYRFCATLNCPIVYFADNGVTDLQRGCASAYIRSTPTTTIVGFAIASGTHLARFGQSTAVETVTQGTKTGQCACEIYQRLS